MLRPVGEIVPLKFDPSEAVQPPEGYQFCWLDSGTTALAIAIRAIVEMKRHPAPRVAIPAYACPDLVAAALWAGAIPVVVDTYAETPWLDSDAIATKPRGYFAAAIAPHFLGIPHPIEALDALCHDRDTVLIEDAAQMSINAAVFRPRAPLVVLSFGRGKPIPVGGGALLCASPWCATVETIASRLSWESSSVALWKLGAAIQNFAMGRFGYSLVRAMPGLSVGATRFVELHGPARVPARIVRIRASLIRQWSVSVVEQQRAIASRIATSPLVCDLASPLGWNHDSPLLRYPVLARDFETRAGLLSRLRRAGIEATPFYGAPVNKVPNAPELSLLTDTKNAQQFADRLLTLPAHSGVTNRDIAEMSRCLECR